MLKSRKLQALFTGTAAVLLLTATSAFAETRHRAETRRDSQNQQDTQTQQTEHRDGLTWDRAQAQLETTRRKETERTDNQRWDRSQNDRRDDRWKNDRREDRWQNDQREDRWKNDQREDRWKNDQREDRWENDQRDDRWKNDQRDDRWKNDRRNDRSQRYDAPRSEAYRYESRSNNRSYWRGEAYRPSWNRAPVVHESRYYAGRVERYEPYRGGFRVWIGGAPYPFFVTTNLWRHYGIRVGALIRLGGYWDPLGYYSAYDYAPYAYSQGDLRGVVENVDYYRRTIVLRDDISGAFVTAYMSGGDPRLGSLRPGDYVDLGGAWSRFGVFNAYNVNDLRPYGYGYDQQAPPPYNDGRPY